MVGLVRGHDCRYPWRNGTFFEFCAKYRGKKIQQFRLPCDGMFGMPMPFKPGSAVSAVLWLQTGYPVSLGRDDSPVWGETQGGRDALPVPEPEETTPFRSH